MANFNIGRLSADIKRELSVALRDTKDSRIANGIVSVSHCELTSDLSYCKVYISCLDGDKTESAVECLTAAAGFFKIPAAHVIVLCDDITQAPGRLRIRKEKLPENRCKETGWRDWLRRPRPPS